jgi:plastocyanin
MRGLSLRTSGLGILLIALLVALGAGCGHHNYLTEQTPGTGNSLKITETDTAITPDHVSATQGDVSFTITNTGQAAHNLAVHIATKTKTSPEVKPGETITWTVEFPRTGQYELYSEVGNDRDTGLSATIQVLD